MKGGKTAITMPEIFGASIQNSAAWATRQPEFLSPAIMKISEFCSSG
jgi:hypothetical protein